MPTTHPHTPPHQTHSSKATGSSIGLPTVPSIPFPNPFLLPGTTTVTPIYFGKKRFELNDWLGNVRVVINDRKTAVNSSSITLSYLPQTISVTDYYSFGGEISERTYSLKRYRFSFNGKEDISEQRWYQDYGARMYHRALGRFISADPLIVGQKKYAYYSPYHFAGNKPIIAVDLDGLEEFYVHVFDNGHVYIRIVSEKQVESTASKKLIHYVQYDIYGNVQNQWDSENFVEAIDGKEVPQVPGITDAYCIPSDKVGLQNGNPVMMFNNSPVSYVPNSKPSPARPDESSAKDMYYKFPFLTEDKDGQVIQIAYTVMNGPRWLFDPKTHELLYFDKDGNVVDRKGNLKAKKPSIEKKYDNLPEGYSGLRMENPQHKLPNNQSSKKSSSSSNSNKGSGQSGSGSGQSGTNKTKKQ